MDVQAQLSQLSLGAPEALAQKIKTYLLDGETAGPDHDVAIVGGGVAALTLALEIRSARPRTRILIIEPTPHPVPEITHTVGESTVEISAHYLRDRLGLADHLHASQIRKMGLRMFFSQGGNTDIAQRTELGSSVFTPQVTYQIDRGRLENELNRRCLFEGVEIAPGRVRPLNSVPAIAHTFSPFSAVTQPLTRRLAGWSMHRDVTAGCLDS